MNKEILERADKLLDEIKEAQGEITILNDIEDYIKRGEGGDQAILTTASSGRRLLIPSATALEWLTEERLRLETKLKQLEKEFEDL